MVVLAECCKTGQGRSQDFSKGRGHTGSNNIVMAFSPWNIVGCCLKKGLQRGVHGYPGTPPPPSYAPAGFHSSGHACTELWVYLLDLLIRVTGDRLLFTIILALTAATATELVTIQMLWTKATVLGTGFFNFFLKIYLNFIH